MAAVSYSDNMATFEVPPGISSLPDPLVAKVLLFTDFKTRMVAQCVCKRWEALPGKYPELLADPAFTITRPDSVVDQDMLEDMATWLLRHGEHVTSLRLHAFPPVGHEEVRVTQPSWREQQLWVTGSACLAACAPTLRRLDLSWYCDLELSHHFMLLRGLTALTVVCDSGVAPAMLVGHTALRHLNLTAFSLSQETPPDAFLPPNLTALHLDVNPDKVPSQLLKLTQLRRLSVAGLDPHQLYRAPLQESLALLPRLTHLHSLDLSHSNLGQLPQGLSALQGLTFLGLRGCHWRQGEVEGVLAPLTNLQALDISYQDLPSLPAAVSALGCLTALAVAGEEYPLGEGPYCSVLRHLEVDLDWVGRESEGLSRFSSLRTLVLAGFGASERGELLQRRLGDLLAPASGLRRLVFGVGTGRAGRRSDSVRGETAASVPIKYAAMAVEFARERPWVKVELCSQGVTSFAAGRAEPFR